MTLAISAIAVALITPMKRGLKGEANKEAIDVEFHVALITPMKRGLKVIPDSVLAEMLGWVALITPMKRGLKGLGNTYSHPRSCCCTNYPDEKGTESIRPL